MVWLSAVVSLYDMWQAWGTQARTKSVYSCNIRVNATPRLKLNTEIRKPLTIFAMFGTSTFKDMGTPKRRYETDWLLSSCARRTSRRRRRSSEQMGTTDARDLTTITTHIVTITDLWLELVPCSLRGSRSKRSTRSSGLEYLLQVDLLYFPVSDQTNDVFRRGGLGFKSW
jgi:hypothetical protein